VREAMDSVRDQEYRPVELIVVDDGSTDDTRSVVRDWMDRNENGQQFEGRYLHQTNRGAPAARNTGMEAATGDYLLFLDSDDQLADDALSALVRALEIKGVGAVYGKYLQVYEDGRDPRLLEQHPTSRSTVVSVLQDCPLTSTVLIDGEVMGDIRWRRNMSCAQELGFFLDLALDGVTFLRIDKVVLRSLHHSRENRIGSRAGGATMARTIGTYLLDVEEDLRALGKEENIACDKALLYFCGLLASKKEFGLAGRLLEKANRTHFLQQACWRNVDPGKFPLFAALFGANGTEALYRINRSIKEIFQ